MRAQIIIRFILGPLKAEINKIKFEIIFQIEVVFIAIIKSPTLK